MSEADANNGTNGSVTQLPPPATVDPHHWFGVDWSAVERTVEVMIGSYIYAPIVFTGMAMIGGLMVFGKLTLWQALLLTLMLFGGIALGYWFGRTVWNSYGGLAYFTNLGKDVEAGIPPYLCSNWQTLGPKIANSIPFAGPTLCSNICTTLGCGDADSPMCSNSPGNMCAPS